MEDEQGVTTLPGVLNITLSVMLTNFVELFLTALQRSLKMTM